MLLDPFKALKNVWEAGLPAESAQVHHVSANFAVLLLEPQLFLQTSLETGVILGIVQSPCSQMLSSKTLHIMAGDILDSAENNI